MNTCQRSQSTLTDKSGNVVIPVSNPKANFLAHRKEIAGAITDTCLSGRYLCGEQVRLFEQEFAAHVGCRYGIGVASGTDALILALRALGLPQYTTVLTNGLSASATAAAIVEAGYVPRFVDMSVPFMTLNVDQLVAPISVKSEDAKPIVLLPVHLYGYPEEINFLAALAEMDHVYLIEDCAQAHGALHEAKMVGSFGAMGCFSFYPTKNLSCLGDGGMIVTDSEDLRGRLLSLREYGWKLRGRSERPGRASRLDEIQAAILRVKLRYLDSENARRKAIAGCYAEGMWDLPIKLPTVLPMRDTGLPRRDHVYHQFVVRVQDRVGFRGFLGERGIETGVHYPWPLHKQPAFETGQSLPVVEKFCDQCVSLPMYPELTIDEINRVIAGVRAYYEQPDRTPECVDEACDATAS